MEDAWVKRPLRKPSLTISERLKRLESIVKKQQQRIKELEQEVKRLDIEEITTLNDQLHKPVQQP
jgi:predicted nuclease with TOPRIM domain